MLGKRRAVVIATAIVAVTAVASTSTRSAQAMPRSAPRCTIVGTQRNDRLVGTDGRDVICGRGGDDVLIGSAGNDILIGGSGKDDMRGGTGADTLRGGSGRDHLDGSTGPDREIGGDGNDTALGGPGSDRLAGGLGNDDLTGGSNADSIDGGAGTNWCIVDGSDTSEHCIYDTTPAHTDQVIYSADTVDVTEATQTVTVRVHVVDDTGVSGVAIDASDATPWYTSRNTAHLVSGDIRDGWWESQLTFPRYARPGTFVPDVLAVDRVQRENRDVLADFPLTVVDTTPDTELPAVTLEKPLLQDSYNVESGPATIPVRAHITDALSGVDPRRIFAILWSPNPDGFEVLGHTASLNLASGNLHDGIWTGEVGLAQGEQSGDWNLEIFVRDRANSGSEYGVDYWGPAMYGGPSMRIDRENLPIPAGLGSVSVLGSDPDPIPPTVHGVSVTPDTVDTLPGATSVTITGQAEDSGSGVAMLAFRLRPATIDNDTPILGSGSTLIAGTTADGTWSGTIQLPQGVPPGTYYLQVFAYDEDGNSAIYMGNGFPDNWFAGVLDTNPTVTVVDTSGP
jgi:hypothetical protein